MEKQKLVEILDKHVNQEAILKDIVLEMLMPKLEKMVAESENKVDDAAWALAKEVLMKAVNA